MEIESIDDVDTDEAGERFVATDEWQEILGDKPVPAGLHYRMNLETGKKEAKLLAGESAAASRRRRQASGRQSNDGAVSALLLPRQPPDDDAERRHGGAPPLVIASHAAQKEAFNLNKNAGQIASLTLNFANCSTEEEQLTVLDSLEDLLHEHDNAVEFFSSAGGLERVVRPALRRGAGPNVREKAAILVGAAAQSQPFVQNIIADKLLDILLDILEEEDIYGILAQRTIYAISCAVRGNRDVQRSFTFKLNGFRRLLRRARHLDSGVVHRKTLTLVSDLIVESAANCSTVAGGAACSVDSALVSALVSAGACADLRGPWTAAADVEAAERAAPVLRHLLRPCRVTPAADPAIVAWLRRVATRVDEMADHLDLNATIDLLAVIRETLEDLNDNNKDEL